MLLKTLILILYVKKIKLFPFLTAVYIWSIFSLKHICVLYVLFIFGIFQFNVKAFLYYSSNIYAYVYNKQVLF